MATLDTLQAQLAGLLGGVVVSARLLISGEGGTFMLVAARPFEVDCAAVLEGAAPKSGCAGAAPLSTPPLSITVPQLERLARHFPLLGGLFDARAVHAAVLGEMPDTEPGAASALDRTLDPQARACLGVPLAVHGVRCGTLFLDVLSGERVPENVAAQAQQPPDQQAALLALARQQAGRLGTTLERLELERTLSAAQRELQLLGRAWQAVTQSGDQSELFRQIIRAVHELLDVEHVGIGVLEDDVIAVQESIGLGQWAVRHSVRAGIVGRVARTGQAMLVPDVREDPDYVSVLPSVISEICVPLLDGTRVVGVLDVESESRRLGEQDLRLLVALGSWLGQALERERLHADTERQRRALDLLHNLRSSFGTGLDTGQSIRAVTHGLRDAFGYSHVSVYLLGGDILTMQHQLGYTSVIDHLPISQGVMGRACRSAQVQWILDMRRDPDALMALSGLNSEVCVPLLRGDQVIGVLNVETFGDSPPLQRWDMELIGSVGGYLQQALERSWLHAQVRDRESQYRLLAEYTNDLVCLHLPGGEFSYLSPSVQALLGYSADELLGRSPSVLLGPDHPVDLVELGEPAAQPRLLWVRHQAGYFLCLEVSVSCIKTPALGGGPGDGQVRYLSSSRDVTARQQAETRLQWMATHDSLTQLFSRDHLYGALQEQMTLAHQTGQPGYAVLYLDMDRFKVINDSLGHTAGDELLQAFARRLTACMEGTLVARLGGDEFAVLMCDLPPGDLSRVNTAAIRLRQALLTPFLIQGRAVQVSVSMGIAPGELHHQTPAEILRDADLSMYRAKRDPSRRVTTFRPEMHTAALRQLQIEADLPHAAARGQMRVVYQPIVDLQTGTIGGYEALLRWQHPHLGNVPPDEFIPLAEELEVISELGQYVLETACRTFQQVPEFVTSASPSPALQVNVSTRQFLRPGFVDVVRRVLADSSFSTGRLHLEITESALIVDVEEAARTLTELRGLGIKIHIDDFGTGYSSLAFLHRFPVDALKIDRAFIARLGEDGVSVKLVQTVLLLAQTMEVDVIAEGIETRTQRDLLLGLGCRRGQGYLFSRPLEVEDTLDLLRAGSGALTGPYD
ncbi:EAL domain-containing protein [Deinococcus arenicola]|uniref:EAL domain-containing protein n=1 Tax=Deinococcus arenicola TaxID=2994950 RepID=A0ABU4DU68_9DEIO|nr:EAL domain-containing protein [Deinococcus sp. ZS9-10]MDV6375981.1 EAL domain-containing protein [Deinococcus sp. ZS9-10]